MKYGNTRSVHRIPFDDSYTNHLTNMHAAGLHISVTVTEKSTYQKYYVYSRKGCKRT